MLDGWLIIGGIAVAAWLVWWIGDKRNKNR
jgi:hypothetical protein